MADIELNREKFVGQNLVGDLIYNTNGNINFKVDTTKYPIRDFPLKSKNTLGAIEIFDLPKEDSQFRYCLAADPIDADYIEQGSLGSIFVFDLILDKIVAEYTGRPQLAEDFYEIARRLCIFYNGKLNYENNLKGLFAQFWKANVLHKDPFQ